MKKVHFLLLPKPFCRVDGLIETRRTFGGNFSCIASGFTARAETGERLLKRV